MKSDIFYIYLYFLWQKCKRKPVIFFIAKTLRLNSIAINWTSNIIYFVIYFIFLCIIFRFFPVWRTGTSTYFSFPASWCLYLVQLIFYDILVLFNNLKRGLSAQMYLYEKKYQAREGARNNIFVSLYGKIPAPSYFLFSVNSYYRYLVVVVVYVVYVVYVDMATISWKNIPFLFE